MQKTSVFQAASFGDLLLNEKQKKRFVLLNNEVTESSPVCHLLFKPRQVLLSIYNYANFSLLFH